MTNKFDDWLLERIMPYKHDISLTERTNYLREFEHSISPINIILNILLIPIIIYWYLKYKLN